MSGAGLGGAADQIVALLLLRSIGRAEGGEAWEAAYAAPSHSGALPAPLDAGAEEVATEANGPLVDAYGPLWRALVAPGGIDPAAHAMFLQVQVDYARDILPALADALFGQSLELLRTLDFSYQDSAAVDDNRGASGDGVTGDGAASAIASSSDDQPAFAPNSPIDHGLISTATT